VCDCGTTVTNLRARAFEGLREAVLSFFQQDFKSREYHQNINEDQRHRYNHGESRVCRECVAESFFNLLGFIIRPT